MITVKFEGGAELTKALEQLPLRASKRIQREALVDAGEAIAKRMAARAPHEPGKPDLRDAMTVSNSRGRDAQEVAVVVGPSKAGWYGAFQEFGTSQHGAQPFARPAFDESIQSSLNLISRAIWVSLAGRGISRSVIRETPVQSGAAGGLL